MGLNLKQLLKWPLTLMLVTLLSVTSYDLSTWILSTEINRMVTAFATGKSVTVDSSAPPEVLFARAGDLQRRGREEEAIAVYHLLALNRDADRDLRIAALYNVGNLYLRRGVRYAQDLNVDRARTATELAKEMYRDTLRLEPEHWDARYNLETAGYIVPDLPSGRPNADDENATSTDAWSDMPGFPSGLP